MEKQNLNKDVLKLVDELDALELSLRAMSGELRTAFKQLDKALEISEYLHERIRKHE